MGSNILKSNYALIGFIAMQALMSVAIAGEFDSNQLPESGPKIVNEIEVDIDVLEHSCDLDHLQADEMLAPTVKLNSKRLTKSIQERASKQPCQKLLEADQKFQALMKQANCEARELYVPTEKEIRSCQHSLRKPTNMGTNQIQKLEEDISNRDKCIMSLQGSFCQKNANGSLLVE